MGKHSILIFMLTRTLGHYLVISWNMQIYHTLIHYQKTKCTFLNKYFNF